MEVNMLIKKIKIPLYHSHLVLIQVKDFKKLPKKWHPGGDLNAYAGMCYHRDNKNSYRYFCIAVLKDTSPKVIVHEAFHCVNRIYHHIGTDYDIQNDEPAAYLMEWIVEQCYENFKINNKCSN